MNIDKFGRHLTVGITHQTSTDKFGRHISSERRDCDSYHQPCIPLTTDGDYDFENKRLCNVKSPIEDSDGANKGYVETMTRQVLQQVSPSASNTFKFAKDLATLTIKVDNISKETDFALNQLNILNSTGASFLERIREIEAKINNLVSPEKLQLEIDLVEHSRAETEKLLKKELKDLEKRINKKIEKKSTL